MWDSFGSFLVLNDEKSDGFHPQFVQQVSGSDRRLIPRVKGQITARRSFMSQRKKLLGAFLN